MSGFVLIFSRDGMPIERSILEEATSRLAHWGWDGCDTLLRDQIALGHQHFWVTPEEIGERQPLTNESGQLMIVFDGRLDNRANLIDAFGLDGAEGREISDASLTLRAYQKWGVDCFAHLLGGFAAAIFDASERRVVLARDPMGERTLFYHLDDRLLVVATEPYAVLAHPEISDELNEISVARWYIAQSNETDATLFAQVREQLAAHVMVVEADLSRCWQYWQPDIQRIHYATTEEYVEHFISLLDASVQARLRTAAPPAVMMSGGFDSTSIAVTAAQLGVSNIRTISWIFDEHKECDERLYIDAVNEQIGAQPTLIPAEEFWPLKEVLDWPHNPSQPTGNPYRLLLTNAYSAASRAGSRVLMNGQFGNHFSLGGNQWLAEMVRDGRWSGFVCGVYRAIKASGGLTGLRNAGLRTVLPLPQHAADTDNDKKLPEWATEYARQLVSTVEMHVVSAPKHTRRDHYKLFFSRMAAKAASQEGFWAALTGIRVERPYLDRRLVEFALSVPAYQLYDGEHHKSLIYHAMKGRLPEIVRQRRQGGSLRPFYRTAWRRERVRIEALLLSEQARWPTYVLPDRLMNSFRAHDDQAATSDTILFWTCLSMDIWRANIASKIASI